MNVDDLFRAKAEIAAAFAGGPGIMIEDEVERDKRLISVTTFIEIEFNSVADDPSNVVSIHSLDAKFDVTAKTYDASHCKIAWNVLVTWLRAHPSEHKVLFYDAARVASSQASYLRTKHEGIEAMYERLDDGRGRVTISARP